MRGSQGRSPLSCQVKSQLKAFSGRSQFSPCPSPRQYPPSKDAQWSHAEIFKQAFCFQQLGSSPPLVSGFFASLVSPVRIMPGQNYRNERAGKYPVSLSGPRSARPPLFILPKPGGSSGGAKQSGRILENRRCQLTARDPAICMAFWCLSHSMLLGCSCSSTSRSPFSTHSGVEVLGTTSAFGLGQMRGHKLSCRNGSGMERDVSASLSVSWRSRCRSGSLSCFVPAAAWALPGAGSRAGQQKWKPHAPPSC